MAAGSTQIWVLLVVLVLGICARLSFGHEEGHAHHQCNHGHHHHHGDDDDDDDHHHHHEEAVVKSNKLPEELAEEEDLKLYGLGHARDHDHDHEHDSNHGELSGIGRWANAMGCPLLVSLASLICLIILPLIFIQGKPSKAIVDSLAVFGAGAILGDVFLHQLPHAFGGEHSHAHDMDHAHSHGESGHFHSHSLKDLSVGLSVLAGIVVFLLVEKIVRYVEDHSEGANKWNHGHHHHHNKTSKKMKDDSDDDQIQEPLVERNGDLSERPSEEKSLDKGSEDSVIDEKSRPESLLRKGKSKDVESEDKSDGEEADLHPPVTTGDSKKKQRTIVQESAVVQDQTPPVAQTPQSLPDDVQETTQRIPAAQHTGPANPLAHVFDFVGFEGRMIKAMDTGFAQVNKKVDNVSSRLALLEEHLEDLKKYTVSGFTEAIEEIENHKLGTRQCISKVESLTKAFVTIPGVTRAIANAKGPRVLG